MTLRLTVNPIACVGHGICADLLPELIALDDWGYPIIAPGDIPADLEAHARRAANGCPTLALILVRRKKSAGRTERSDSKGWS